MYYRKRNSGISADMGAVLNKDNAVQTLAMQDITEAVGDENGAPAFSGERRPEEGNGAGNDMDFALMQALYSGINKKMLPYVKEAVEENIYEGSPIMRDIGPDRASLDKIINEAIDNACAGFDGAEEICLENSEDEWGGRQLLYDLTEALVLAEIFLKKRSKKM